MHKARFSSFDFHVLKRRQAELTLIAGLKHTKMVCPPADDHPSK